MRVDKSILLDGRHDHLFEVAANFHAISQAAARFVADSPLEGSGFELSVPPGRRRLRTGSCPSAKVI
jgi:hypothetical protein